MKGTERETLKSVDKLQANLDKANTSKLAFENRGRSAKDQVATLKRQVQELQSQAEKDRAATSRMAEMEAELEETVAWGRTL